MYMYANWRIIIIYLATETFISVIYSIYILRCTVRCVKCLDDY